jgi:hypothetical protein
MSYYLADGIYAKCSTFVTTIPKPDNKMEAHFAKMQQAAHKDIENLPCFAS